MARSPEVLIKALNLHNNVIRHAQWWVKYLVPAPKHQLSRKQHPPKVHEAQHVWCVKSSWEL